MKNKILEIKNLSKNYHDIKGEIKAIDNISFTVYDNLGNALEDDVIQQCDFKWIIPMEDTMLKVSDIYD